MPPRMRHHMYGQAGDGMSLPMISVALLWLYSQFELPMTTEPSVVMSGFLGTMGRALKREASRQSGVSHEDGEDDDTPPLKRQCGGE